MKQIILSMCMLCTFSKLHAQITSTLTSPSGIVALIPAYSQVTTINTSTISYTPSTPDPDSNPIDDDSTTEEEKILNYGNLLTTNLNISNGNITSTTLGKVWTLKISIPNALNIGLIFTQFNLSATASMYIYNEEKTILKGPIKKADFTYFSKISVSSINTNKITIYVFEPNNFGALQSTLTVGNVIAGYDIFDDLASGQSNRPSVNCDPMIMCRTDKLPTARSVMRIGVNGRGFTGTIINNEANNGRPFILTCFHGLDLNKDKTLQQSEIDGLQNAFFEFRFWRTQCNGAVNNISVQFSGAQLRAQNKNTDMILLEMLNPPGVGDGVNYAGWNRTSDAPDDNLSFVLHHPQGRDMRITTTDDVKTWFWNSLFWSAHYSSGTVDRGSSGSGLFNQSNQIVGQLRSGWSNCNYTDFGDRYGKLSISYGAGLLQQFLSPTQNLSSTNALILSPVSMSGSTFTSCNTNMVYSVPNLIGCTFAWTTSPNISIVSGQGTANLTVQSTTINNSSGWVEVTITDSKGTANGRLVTIRKNVTVGRPSITGSYSYPSGGNQLLNFGGSGQYNPVCNLQSAQTNMVITGTNSLSWSRISATPSNTNWSTNGINLNFYYWAVNQQSVFRATASNGCGSTSVDFGFRSIDCGGSGCERFSVSPNPVSGGALNIIVPNIPPPCFASNNQASESMKQSTILAVTVYDQNGNIKIFKRFDKALKSTIPIENLPRGYYLVEVKSELFTEKHKIIVE